MKRLAGKKFLRDLTLKLNAMGSVLGVEVGVDPVSWTPLSSFSEVSDATISSGLSAGVSATNGGTGPIRADA
jgi:hypothetical protein